MNSKRRLIVGALAIIVALLGASGVMASGGAAPLRQNGAPVQLSYQGFLLDPTTGDPVPDGNYTLTFAIYDHATSTDLSHRLRSEVSRHHRFLRLQEAAHRLLKLRIGVDVGIEGFFVGHSQYLG